MRACVVIPSYNEAPTISKIVSDIRKMGLELVVIDDGSRDETGRIAREAGAVVLKNINNQGKGASLVRGFGYLIKEGFDTAIIMDGDFQHLPGDIPVFLNAAKNLNSCLIIGNRMSHVKNMPVLRYLTNKFMSWLISRIIGERIPDTQCGFRLIKGDFLKTLSLRTSKFEVESEIIFRAAKAGVEIRSVPIQTVYGREKSHINPFIDTVRFFSFLLKELWNRRN